MTVVTCLAAALLTVVLCYAQWDANKDGAVTLQEVTDFYANRPAGGGTPAAPPVAPKAATQPATLRAARDGFVPDAPFVGQVNGSYGDPEFSETANQVVFQDMTNRVWIGDIDPETGLFKTATGKDYLIDENITLIFDRPPQGRKFSTNGPEWTRDDKGHCIVYTKQDKSGLMQQWLGRLVDGKSVVTQLTTQKMDCYGNMPSRFMDGKPPRIAFTHEWPIWQAKASWVFANRPDELYGVPGFDYNKMSMWSAVSADFLFVHRSAGAKNGQIGRADADTGKVTVLTNDGGEKDDPGMFRAPEFGGEICLMANVDNRAIAIYRDLKSPDGTWTRVATLTLPADAPHKFISSPEPIAPATGLGGVSYIALLARESKDRNTPGSIWVLGLGKDPANRLVRRVDDGTVPRASVIEPEPFVGKSEAYIYYNYYDFAGGQWGLRRAKTGIKVAAYAPEGGTNTATAWHQQPITYLSDGLKITGLASKPDGAGPFPLVLVNHGGFEPARTVGPLLDLFAKVGYVAVASDYRGVAASEGKNEVAKGEVNDVLQAMAWARSLPCVDGKRVVMWGHSHGGCIALLAAARSPDIRAIVTIGAPVELAECYRHWVNTVERVPVLRPLIGLSLPIGGTPDQVPEAWRLRSPLYVAARIKCPVLMVQGGKDDAVPAEQARRMVTALEAAGNREARLLFDAEAGHVLDAKAYDRLGKKMISFLNQHAGLSALP